MNSDLCARKTKDLKKHIDRADFGGIISLSTKPAINDVKQHKTSASAIHLETKKTADSKDLCTKMS